MVDETDWDDPEQVAAWETGQRDTVIAYLSRQRVPNVRPAQRPSWSIPPYVAIWRVTGQSGDNPSWWAISGDLPTDFVPADGAPAARDAARLFAERWRAVSAYMARGERHPTVHIGESHKATELGPLLSQRAATLAEWASEEEYW